MANFAAVLWPSTVTVSIEASRVDDTLFEFSLISIYLIFGLFVFSLLHLVAYTYCSHSLEPTSVNPFALTRTERCVNSVTFSFFIFFQSSSNLSYKSSIHAMQCANHPTAVGVMLNPFDHLHAKRVLRLPTYINNLEQQLHYLLYFMPNRI